MGSKLSSPHLSNDDGITLIELLVVVAVMSVLAIGVTITTVRPSGSETHSDQTWFMRSFESNRTLAVQGRQSRGLNVGPNGLIPVMLTRDGWEPQSSAHRWQGRVTHQAKQYDVNLNQRPDIVFFPNGQTSAFDISFSTSQSRTFRCTSDGWTELKCLDS
ncbi:MAG: prepilin-type N-terminal cleavage/methylation domain-containing protein [Vibrio splendidus]